MLPDPPAAARPGAQPDNRPENGPAEQQPSATSAPSSRQAFDAVILAGGTSARLGTDKTRLTIGGAPLLDRVLAAVDGADRVVVVGDPRPTARPVHWCREDPPLGGPAAGVVTGLAAVRADHVVVLAGDLPRLRTGTVTRLLAALAADGIDGALLTDTGGRRQHLTGAHRTAALRRAAAARSDWSGAAVHRLLAPLRIVTVPPDGDEACDVDTAADLAAAESVAESATESAAESAAGSATESAGESAAEPGHEQEGLR